MASYLVAGELDAPEAGSLGRFLGIPVSLEATMEAGLEFLAEDVHSSPWQLVVEMRDDEVECCGQFVVHVVEDCVGLVSKWCVEGVGLVLEQEAIVGLILATAHQKNNTIHRCTDA